MERAVQTLAGGPHGIEPRHQRLDRMAGSFDAGALKTDSHVVALTCASRGLMMGAPS